MKAIKAIQADSITELAEKLNAFQAMKNTFATQVFLNNGKYDALCYYDEVKQ
jgi:hypothetical protein